MLPVIKLSKSEINLPVIVLIIGLVIGVYHWFSYLIPFTNNAFVATNIMPVAADVSGFVTKIFVKNGQLVKEGDPLIEVYPLPYQLAYDYAKANYEEAIEKIGVIEQETRKTRDLLSAANYELETAQIRYKLKDNRSVREAVPIWKLKSWALVYMQQKKNAMRCATKLI